MPDGVQLLSRWRWLLLCYPVVPALGLAAVIFTGKGPHSATVALAIWMSTVWVVLLTGFVVAIFHEYRLLQDRIEHRSWRGRRWLSYSEIAAIEAGVELVGRTRSPSAYVDIRPASGRSWRIHSWMVPRSDLAAFVRHLGRRVAPGPSREAGEVAARLAGPL